MMDDKVKIAAVQMDPKITKNSENLEKILSQTRVAANNGAQLIVFPECALTGYVFGSREEAIPFMETVPGPATDKLAATCKQLGVYVVVGLLEIDGDKCFNAAALIGPEGLVGKCRKNHLPFLGIDRFVDPGDKPFKVHQTPIGNIGMHICYDGRFPESARIMTLLGADILALPINGPKSPRSRVTDVRSLTTARAIENRVHLVAVDRVGREHGIKFIGRSMIVDATGKMLAKGNADDEQILYGEVSLAAARQKRIIIKPGEFELDLIADRRPELYGEITKAST